MGIELAMAWACCWRWMTAVADNTVTSLERHPHSQACAADDKPIHAQWQAQTTDHPVFLAHAHCQQCRATATESTSITIMQVVEQQTTLQTSIASRSSSLFVQTSSRMYNHNSNSRPTNTYPSQARSLGQVWHFQHHQPHGHAAETRPPEQRYPSQ
jgi:vesicle coat complex subunit